MDSDIEKIEEVKNKLKELCAGCGIDYGSITVIAASKTVTPERLKCLKPCGINICGENRVQELLSKYGLVDTEWHFIGRLQTNKVKYIIDKVTLIQSLDRLELAAEIERQCVKRNLTVNALIEVNCGGEESKGGISLENTEEFYESLKVFPHIKICGLMSVMPINAGEQYYLQIKKIYDTIKVKAGQEFKYLSVGMSNDYIRAVKCGSNMIRLGRVFFGERNYGMTLTG